MREGDGHGRLLSCGLLSPNEEIARSRQVCQVRDRLGCGISLPSAEAFSVFGAFNVIAQNTATVNAGDGLSVRGPGSDHIVEGNDVEKNGGDGIVLRERTTEADALAFVISGRIANVRLCLPPDNEPISHRSRRMSSRAVSQAQRRWGILCAGGFADLVGAVLPHSTAAAQAPSRPHPTAPRPGGHAHRREAVGKPQRSAECPFSRHL